VNLGKIGILIFAYNRPSHLKRVLIAIESLNITSEIVLIIDKKLIKKHNTFFKKNLKYFY